MLLSVLNNLLKKRSQTMKKLFKVAAFVCFGGVMLTSCVAKKKYLEATNRADKEHKDNLALQQRLAEEMEYIKKLSRNINDLNAKIAALRDSINGQQNNIATLNGTITGLNDRLSSLGSEKENTSRQLNKTREQMDEQRKRLEQLQAMIDKQHRATEALRKKIADALNGFNSSELTVTMKNGKVYISMQESLLFPSGSAEVNPRGKEALSKVASVLNTSKDINIDIEGHTDSLPIHTAKYADNWALSTARATSIAHVLIDEYKVVPAKLIASGRSQYDPVAPNSTPEGRAKNRRSEIILEPRLDELVQLMNDKQDE
jgi:chemotaxis protein MotB